MHTSGNARSCKTVRKSLVQVRSVVRTQYLNDFKFQTTESQLADWKLNRDSNAPVARRGARSMHYLVTLERKYVRHASDVHQRIMPALVVAISCKT